MTTATKRPTTALHRDNRRELRAAMQRLNIGESGTIGTSSAFALLRVLGYDATRERFEYHLSRGYFRAPPKALGRYSWSVGSILAFADSLERSRAWLPLSLRHDAKRTPEERQRDAQRFLGLAPPTLDEFASTPTHELLLLMRDTADGDLREVVAAMIQHRLDAGGES